jgi:hypothetical protein
MSLADAGAWMRHGLDRPLFPHKSDRWPECLPLAKWLAAHLPDGGERYQTAEWSLPQLTELFRAFFATPEGAPFNDFECRSMLDELVDSGNGDPLRWSVTRIEQVLDRPQFYHDFELHCILELPDLLRAYIPFAHAQCGIPEALTAEALAFIARKARAYRREVWRKQADASSTGADRAHSHRRSSASRSQLALSAATSYVLCRNSSSRASGSSASRTAV